MLSSLSLQQVLAAAKVFAVAAIVWWIYGQGVAREAMRRDLDQARATIATLEADKKRNEAALAAASKDAAERDARAQDLEQQVKDYEAELEQLAAAGTGGRCTLSDAERERLLRIR